MGQIVGCLFLLLLSFGGMSQERFFTLDSCVSYALEHRIEIKISENSGENLVRNAGYIRQQQLPDLNASFSHNMNWGRSLNMEKYEWEDSKNQYGNMSVSSSLTLFAGLRLRYQIQNAKLNVARQMTVHQKLQNEIRLEVIQSFYELLAAQMQKELMTVFYESDVKQEKKVNVLDSVGRMSAPDRLEFAGQTHKALMDRNKAEEQYQLALLKLQKSINYEGKEQLEVVRNINNLSLKVPEVKQLYPVVLEHLPALKMFYWDSLLLKNQLKQLRGNFSPTFSLNGMLYTRYQNGLNNLVSGKPYAWWEQLKDKNYKQVGISLSVPLFNRSKIRQQIQEVKTDMLNQSLNKRKLLVDIYYEMEQMCLEAVGKKVNLVELEKQVKNSAEILRLRKIQFAQGKLSIYDLLISETNLRNAQIALLLERFGLICYLEMLKVYIGVKL